MKIISLIALLALSSTSFGNLTEFEVAEKKESKALIAEIASQELILKSLKTRLAEITKKNEVTLFVTIKDNHYIVAGKSIPLIKSSKQAKKTLDTLFHVIKKECVLKKANTVKIYARESASYRSVQDVIEAAKEAGIQSISIMKPIKLANKSQ